MSHPLFTALREASQVAGKGDMLLKLEKLKAIYEEYKKKPDTAESKTYRTELTRPSTRPRPRTR